MWKHIFSSRLLILLLTVSSLFLHFYNLSWGAPYYFHPDERNIAYALTQLVFTTNFNPHFFAYGSLPMYVTFFISLVVNKGVSPIPFDTAILSLRFISAFLATGITWLLFVIGKRLWNKSVGLFAAALWTFSTGAIQYAHFGTFEMWLTFFGLLLFYILAVFIKSLSLIKTIVIGIVLGVLIATKVTSLIFVPFLAGIYIFIGYKKKKRSFLYFFITLFITGLIYVITNPFTFLDKPSFINSMQYESNVALGNLKVFYTGEFLHTTPIVYQFFHVYPFILNPIITLVFLLTLLPFMTSFRKKSVNEILLLLFFLITFSSQAFLYVKWTRYLIPTLPFIYLIISIVIDTLAHKKVKLFSTLLLITTSIIFSCSYFITAYVEPDTRVTAVQNATKLLHNQESILSESYDLGITPFNSDFPHITLFNFYDLENDPSLPRQLTEELKTTDAIILPSQRLLKTRLNNMQEFPLGANFYNRLMNGSLGFTTVYETPCDVFCEIAYLGDPIYHFEGTAYVFDRPTVMIFTRHE